MAGETARKSPRSPDTIYVRVDPDIKKWLFKYARDRDITEKHVIEQVLRYFKTLPDEIRKDVLRDPNSFFAAFGSLMELMGWAEHAFSLRHWEWALEAYNKLAEKTVHIPGLQKIAQYKLGYCWLDQASFVRREAFEAVEQGHARTASSRRRGTRTDEDVLDSFWKDSLEAADEAVSMSIYHNLKFVELGGHHPVIRFNLACAWSMRAQYAVEKAMTWRGWSPGPAGGSRATRDEELWKNTLGPQWRQKLGDLEIPKDERDRLEVEIDGYGKRAKVEFDLMLQEPLGDEASEIRRDDQTAPPEGLALPANVGFLVRTAMTDADLVFMRYDMKASKIFDAWAEGAEKEESMLKSHRRLRNKRSKDFLEMKKMLEELK